MNWESLRGPEDIAVHLARYQALLSCLCHSPPPKAQAQEVEDLRWELDFQ